MKSQCQECKTYRVEEETTGGKSRHLEQNMATNQNPCNHCIEWVEEIINRSD